MEEANEVVPYKPPAVPDDFYWDKDFGRWCKIIGEINGNPIYEVFNLSRYGIEKLYGKS